MIILNLLMDSNGNTDWFRVVIGIAVLIIVLFISREINLWFFRINDFIKNQEEQTRLLKKMSGEEDQENKPVESLKKVLPIIKMCLVVPGYAQTIDGGNAYSIMLCSDSMVWTVGSNTAGQLGNGTTTDELTPIVVGLSGVVSVQSGSSHSLALKSDGTVWSWGNNARGQLGNNTINPSSTPIQVPGLSNVVKIISGGSHNVAIESDSTAWIWGSNQLNQINSTSTDKLFPIPGGINVIDMAAGVNYTATLQDAIIEVQGISTKYLILSNVISLGSGVRHFFMIKSDSTILAWGDNQYGQLGDGTTTSLNGNTATQVSGLTNIISITGGKSHSIALKDDGTVWVWGWNALGQLGDNTLIDKLTPIQVPGLDSVIEIAAGDQHCMARRADSTIWVWGQNILGQLGNGTNANSSIPVKMDLSCIPFQCPAPQVYSDGNLEICSDDSILVYGAYRNTPGTYQDSLITSEGCDSILETVLTVNSLPSVIFTGLNTTYCKGGASTTLTGTPSGGILVGNNLVGDVFTPSLPGTFTITYFYTDGNGCENSYLFTTEVVNCTGIDDMEMQHLNIYPNPSTGVVYIQSTGPVQIINTFGQVVYNGPGNIEIDLSGYGNAVYFMKSGAMVKKLVITQ